MGFIRRGCQALALLSSIALAAPSRAQTSNGPSITLSPNGVTHSIARTGYRLGSQINQADCIDDDVLTFSLELSNRSSYSLEAWVGTACDSVTNRTTPLSTSCWKLFSTVPDSNLTAISLHVRDILFGYTTSATSTPTTSTSTPTPFTSPLITGTGPEACVDPLGIPVVEAFSVTFLLVDPSDASAQAEASWPGTFKIVPPPPP